MSLSKSSKAAWIGWSIASLFYAYQYILRVMPNILLSDIMEQFHFGAATFGQFTGIYYIGYSLMHIPVGLMLDRFGPKKVMSGCILLTVLGLLPLILGDHWLPPICGRLLIGMGSSAAILGLFKLIRMSFSEEKFPRMVTFSVAIGLIGAIYGGGPIEYMRGIFGYGFVIELLALIGVVLAVITYFLVPHGKKEENTSMIKDVQEVLGNKYVVLSCVFAGCMVGPMEGFGDGWATLFLKEVYGLEGSLAASLPSMIFIGMCFGGPLLNFIGEKMGYLLTIFLAGLLMVLSFFLLLGGFLSAQMIGINLLGIGICSGYQILAIYKATSFVRENVAGLTTAVANMIIMIFGYAFHALIGGVVNFFGGPTLPQALILGITVLPIALMIGSLGFFGLFLVEKRQQIQKA